MTARFFACLAALVLVVALPGAAFGGPLLGDTDLDGVDDLFDNCINISNSPGTGAEPAQYDADGDGCGNRCDCDYDNSGLCTITDFNILKACFNASVPEARPEPAATHDPTCAESDQDGSGVVTITDFNHLKAGFNFKAGPSGNPLRDLAVCGP